MSVPKELVKKRLAIGVLVAVGLYFGFKYAIPKLFPPKINTNPNFSNADGGSEGDFVAKQYDPKRKATWISYKGSDIVGYWQEGVIKQGTIINELT